MSATGALAVALAALAVCGLLAALFARRAGENWFGWGVVGSAFGPIGLLVEWLELRGRTSDVNSTADPEEQEHPEPTPNTRNTT